MKHKKVTFDLSKNITYYYIQKEGIIYKIIRKQN